MGTRTDYNLLSEVPDIDGLVDVNNLIGVTTMGKTQILGNQIKDLSIIAGQIAVTTDSGIDDLQAVIDGIKVDIGNVLAPMNFKGTLDASSLGTQLDNAKLGDMYYVSVAGTILTSVELKVGDMIIVNKTVTGTPVAADIDKIDNTESTDILRQGQVDDSTLQFSDNTLHIKNSGVGTSQIASDAVDKTKINSDVAGAGLAQAVDGSLKVNFVKEGFTATAAQTEFVLAHTPVVGSEDVFLNGLLQVEGSGNDYTIVGGTITFNNPAGYALEAGEVLVVKYLY
jgi:hypothetical protein